MKRKGFTLVELLIVIVVIGILSAMMMLSSTEAVSSAKASNIVSNLRNLKTAALAYYTDNMDTVDTATEAPKMADIWKYMNNSSTTTNEGDSTTTTANNAVDQANYAIELGSGNDDRSWFLKYTIDEKTGSKSEQESVKSKLAGRAKSVGLLAGKSTSGEYKGGASNNTVYYFVR